MMMKALMFHQQQQPQVEENMSNLTSASGEAASISSGNRNNNELTATNYPQLHHHHHQQPQQQQQQQFFAQPPPPQSQPLAKKKRNLPGNPDPDAEVIALSPKTLMATNRFMCEICNKGFQRDQNLQLHRRGHNLPWKLKQRTSKEIRKKVYVCPEASCVHHDPARALGDLTGVKKHFSRKHGEKKWKCEKCSKRYAVQSDCKAHYKTCGTREYRCDCGTLFSRRDSFITHRAFCDALAEESARDRILLPSQPPPTGPSSTPPPPPPPHVNLQIPQLDLHAFSLKKEQRYYNSSATLRPELPSWLGAGPGSGPPIYHDHVHDQFTQTHHQDLSSNPNPSLGPTLLSSHHYHHPSAAPIASPHMSATALLQKAAQMGATSSSSSSKTSTSSWPHLQDHHQAHVSVDSSAANNANTIASSTPHFGLNLPSREGLVIHGLGPHRRPGSGAAGTTVSDHAPLPPPPPLPINSFLQDMVMMNSLSSGFVEGTSFEDSFVGVGVLNSKKDGNFHDTLLKTTTNNNHGGNAGNEGLTRDFLGLRPLSHHSHILNMAGIGDCVNTSAHHEQHFQSPKPWQG